MKRLLIHCAAGLAVLIAVTTLVWLMPGGYQHDLAALINKRDLLVSRRAPRLILMGGSNLLPIHCADIEASLGRPVVNMGLFGGVSIAGLYDEIKGLLVPGDIVLLVSEYPVLLHRGSDKADGPYGREANKFLFAMSPYRHVLIGLRCGELGDISGMFHDLIQLKVKTMIRNLATGRFALLRVHGLATYRADYDDYGSVRAAFKKRPGLRERGTLFKKPLRGNLRYVKRIADDAALRGVTLVLSFPPFPDDEFANNRAVIQQLYCLLRDDFKITLINTPSDAIYPPALFADTVNHLNAEGEAIRWRKLVQELMPHLR